MNKSKTIQLMGSILLLLSLNVSADYVSNSTVGAGGYDLVSYQTDKKPLPGNGNFVATIDQVSYIFANQENLKTFNKNPNKYMPQYGGFCAFGASLGKKFIGDPNVWEVVDGKLYFNLDNGIKATWVKDISGNIVKANKKWQTIKNKAASTL